MTTRNDITGDALVSKASTNAYRDNWDAIFGSAKRNRVINMEMLVDTVGDLFESDPDFNAREWAEKWITKPNEKLGGKCPEDLIGSLEGFQQVMELFTFPQADQL